MKITYLDKEYDADDELSFRDFTGWDFLSRPEYDFSNKIIYASCFLNETPDIEIFDNTTNATFIKCNLSNVSLPLDCIAIDCIQTRYKVQNDLNDWIIDETNLPLKPIDWDIFTKLNLPIPKPEDIPDVKVDTRIDLIKEAETKVGI